MGKFSFLQIARTRLPKLSKLVEKRRVRSSFDFLQIFLTDREIENIPASWNEERIEDIRMWKVYDDMKKHCRKPVPTLIKTNKLIKTREHIGREAFPEYIILQRCHYNQSEACCKKGQFLVPVKTNTITKRFMVCHTVYFYLNE